MLASAEVQTSESNDLWFQHVSTNADPEIKETPHRRTPNRATEYAAAIMLCKDPHEFQSDLSYPICTRAEHQNPYLGYQVEGKTCSFQRHNAPNYVLGT